MSNKIFNKILNIIDWRKIYWRRSKKQWWKIQNKGYDELIEPTFQSKGRKGR